MVALPAMHRRLLLGLLAPIILFSCDHEAERQQLMGHWEGTIALPATGEPVPISYDFRGDGLTVTIGLGDQAITQSWSEWEIVGEVRGNLLIEIRDSDGRGYATFARALETDGEFVLWDRDTEESTGARIRRVDGAQPLPEPEPASVGDPP